MSLIDDEKPFWERMPFGIQSALEATASDIPFQSLALYARWWQLETWLRSVVYVELRARFASDWIDHLPTGVSSRQSRDAQNAYMATPDGAAELAYLDVKPLFDLIESQWDLLGYALIDKPVWLGRIVELQKFVIGSGIVVVRTMTI